MYDFRLTSLKTVWKQPTSFPLPDVGQYPCLCRHPLDDILYEYNFCEIYKIQHLDYTALTADPNLFARPCPTRDSMRSSISLEVGVNHVRGTLETES